MKSSFRLAALTAVISAPMLLSGCATESSQALVVQKTQAATRVYVGARAPIAVGKFDNRSSFMRGVFSDGTDRLGSQAKTIEEQRKLLEQSIHNINATREILDSTRESLFNLKTSLDRDYFVFQLHKKSGIIRVKDVGLRLKKTRKKDQRYDTEIFYDDKKMSKDKVAANEPIYFLKMGYKKPYELVVTQVLDDKVNGYLSVPKVAE